MDFELTEEQRAFAETARDFAQAEFAPHAAQWDAEAIFPQRGHCQGRRTRLLRALRARRRIGGLALPRLDATLVFEEMAAVDPSTTAFITIHNMATWMLGTWGSPAVRDRWGADADQRAQAGLLLPDRTRRRARTPASLKTRADREGDEYVINGGKAFISGAGATDVLVLMARTGGGGRGRHLGVCACRPTPPASATARRNTRWAGTASPRAPSASTTCASRPTTCWAAKARAFSIAMKGLDGGRINIATCSVGAAQGALDAARRYLHERKQFGKPLASFQALQFKLADMATELVAARQMVRLAASKLDAGAPRCQHLLRDGQALCHRRRLQRLQRRAATARRLRLPERIPAGAPGARQRACTRSSKAPTKSCASSSPGACSRATRPMRFASF